MSAIDDLFADLRKRGRKALMPFLTAGDPDIDVTRQLIVAAKKAGADLCEIGFPYSDPIADGPVIQASYQRALDAGFRIGSAMELPSTIDAAERPPLVAMTSYSIVNRMGIESFVERAQTSGYAGVIVPDLLVEEADGLAEVCKKRDFNLIQLVTPTTPRERQVRIANTSSGFLYYVSVTGITGERTSLPPDLADNVRWLGEQTDLPICIGFGISGPETARAVAPAADGLIVGSAVVRRIAESAEPDAAVESVAELVGQLRRAIDEVA